MLIKEVPDRHNLKNFKILNIVKEGLILKLLMMKTDIF